MKQNYIYIWCLLADDGFYMEPDVSLIKVSFTRKELENYIRKHPEKHRHYFIEKKKCNLFL